MDSKELYAIYEQHPVITTDSRECPKGSIFIALKGESFDGNKLLRKVVQLPSSATSRFITTIMARDK